MQFDASEISIAREVALLQMTADTEPIIRRLDRQVNMFGGFQLEDSEATRAGDRKYIKDAVYAAAIGEDLRVDKTRIERGIDARDVFADDGFEPSFGLQAMERMARVTGERMPVDLEIVQQAFERGPRCGAKLLAPVAGAE